MLNAAAKHALPADAPTTRSLPILQGARSGPASSRRRTRGASVGRRRRPTSTPRPPPWSCGRSASAWRKKSSPISSDALLGWSAMGSSRNAPKIWSAHVLVPFARKQFSQNQCVTRPVRREIKEYSARLVHSRVPVGALARGRGGPTIAGPEEEPPRREADCRQRPRPRGRTRRPGISPGRSGLPATWPGQSGRSGPRQRERWVQLHRAGTRHPLHGAGQLPR